VARGSRPACRRDAWDDPHVQSHWTAALDPATNLQSGVAHPLFDGPDHFDGITRVGGALDEFVVG
jgi:hypothetical protein